MCMRAQSLSRVRLWDPVDCSPPGFSVHWISQVRVTGVGCHFLLEEIFPARELNPSLLHWQASSLPLSHQESWKKIIQLCKFMSWRVARLAIIIHFFLITFFFPFYFQNSSEPLPFPLSHFICFIPFNLRYDFCFQPYVHSWGCQVYFFHLSAFTPISLSHYAPSHIIPLLPVLGRELSFPFFSVNTSPVLLITHFSYYLIQKFVLLAMPLFYYILNIHFYYSLT